MFSRKRLTRSVAAGGAAIAVAIGAYAMAAYAIADARSPKPASTIAHVAPPAPSLVSRVRLVPSVLTFHNPFWLVSALPIKELFSTRNNRVVLLIARTAVIAIPALVKMVCGEPPVAGRTLIVLGPR